MQFYSVGAVGFCELFGDCLGAVGGAVVDDDDFPVEATALRFIRHSEGVREV